LVWLSLAWPCSAAGQNEAAPATEPATRQFTAATALESRQEYAKAAQAWVKFIDTYRTDPRLDRAFHALGVCYLKSHQLRPAIESFQIVLDHFPTSELVEPAWLNLGLSQYARGQSGEPAMYAQAIATLSALATKYPRGNTLPQAIFCLGECYYAQGRKQEAARMYAQVVDNYPRHDLTATAMYDMGVAQQELEQQEAAGKTFDAFVERFPKDPLVAEVHLRRGEGLFSSGQYEAAAKHFAAAVVPSFNLADRAMARQAVALAKSKQFAAAGAVYEALIAKFPQSPYVSMAGLSGGKCYFQAGELAKARTLLVRALDDPALAGEAAHWLSRVLLKQRQPAEALEAVEKILAKKDRLTIGTQLLMDRADALDKIPERRGEAIAAYAELAAKYPHDPQTPQALHMAAYTALARGDYAAAKNYAEDFWHRFPDHASAADALYVAAECSLQLGQLADAQSRFERLLQKYPGHSDAPAWKVRRGLAIYLAKHYAQTVAFLQPLLPDIRNLELLAEAQYLIGSSQAELKQFDEAIRALEASLAAAPRWRQADDALLVLAFCRRQENDLVKAQIALRRLIAEFPESGALPRAWFRLGEYYYAGNDFPAAAKAYQQVLDRWSRDNLAPHAAMGLSWSRLDQGDYRGAQQAASLLLEKYHEPKLVARARYVRGLARQQLKELQGAGADIEAFLAGEPNSREKSDARYALALCQVGLVRQADAVATLSGLLRDDPGYAGSDKVLYELGWAEKSLGKEKEAAEAFRRLAQSHPKSLMAGESALLAGEFEYRRGGWAAAAAMYQAAVAAAGQTDLGEKAAHRLGWTHFHQGQFAAAAKAFHQQRVGWPSGPMAADGTFMEAESLAKQGKWAEALAAYATVQNPSGKDFAVLTALHAAAAAAELHQWDKGLDWLDKAARQFPDSGYLPEILYEQGQALENLGRPDEAVRRYQQVIAKSDQEFAARAQLMIGKIQSEKKDYAEAIKSFIKVSYGYSYVKWQAEAAYETARCYEKQGKSSEAIKQYQELLSSFPQSERAAAARERLKSLKP
jgi:TolA-binding protein